MREQDGFMRCEMKKYGSRCGGMHSLPGCRAVLACQQEKRFAWGTPAFGESFGAALAETTVLISPLMGCKGRGQGGRAPTAPLWVLRLWLPGSGTLCMWGRGCKLLTNPSKEGLRVPFSSGDSPAVIKRLGEFLLS